MYIKFATSIIKNATEKYMVAIPKNKISLIDIFPKSNLKKVLKIQGSIKY